MEQRHNLILAGVMTLFVACGNRGKNKTVDDALVWKRTSVVVDLGAVTSTEEQVFKPIFRTADEVWADTKFWAMQDRVWAEEGQPALTVAGIFGKMNEVALTLEDRTSDLAKVTSLRTLIELTAQEQ